MDISLKKICKILVNTGESSHRPSPPRKTSSVDTERAFRTLLKKQRNK